MVFRFLILFLIICSYSWADGDFNSGGIFNKGLLICDGSGNNCVKAKQINSQAGLVDLADGSVYLNGGTGGSVDGTIYGWTRVGTNVKLTNAGDNVGIGTSAPQQKLEVNGSIYADNGIYLGVTPVVGTATPGKLYWDTTYKTLDLNTENGVNLQIGQESFIRVIAGETISDGQAIYFGGSSGVFPLAFKAIANSETTARVKGIATENIVSGSEGFVTNFGVINGLNTSTMNAGDLVYLSGTVSGTLTNVKPEPPLLQTVIGRVIVKDASVGSVYRSSSPNYPISGDQVNLQTAGMTSTKHSIQDWFNTYSVGMVSGGAISNAGSQTITVTAGNGIFAVGSLDTDPVAFGNWSEVTSGTLTDNRVTWVTAQYNSGSPQIVLIEGSSATDYSVPAAINYQDVFPLGYVTRAGTELYISNNPRRMQDAVGGLISRFYQTLPLSRDEKIGGLIIGETGTRNITLTAGKLWDRQNQFVINAIDTTLYGAPTIANTFATVYRNSGTGFIETDGVIYWPNTRYDNGSGTLQTVASNRYANLWWYLTTEGYLTCVYGRNVYNTPASAALGSVPATLPLNLNAHARLIGRTTFQGSGSTFTANDSVFSNIFSPTAATTHNNLSGLQGGTTGEYYHKTAAEYAGNYSNTITIAGNLGIGSTAPQQKLDVEGNVYFANGTFVVGSNTINFADTTNGYVLGFDTGTQTWSGVAGGGSATWGAITGSVLDQTDLAIYALASALTPLAPKASPIFTGNVGIGTTAGATFSVNGGASIGTYNASADANGLNVSGNVGIGTNSASAKLQVMGQLRISGDGASNPLNIANNFNLFHKTLGSTEYAIFQPVGTNSPMRLSVFGTGTVAGDSNTLISGLKIFQTTDATSLTNSCDVGMYMTSSGFRINAKQNGTCASFPIQFGRQDTTIDMTIYGGNVGIGSTAPTALLDVNGTIYGHGNVGIGTSVARALLDVNGAIYASGNVGIGSTEPRQKLDVDGAIYADEAIYCGGGQPSYINFVPYSSDPCPTIPSNSYFTNTTNTLCLCNGAGADVQVSGGAACF